MSPERLNPNEFGFENSRPTKESDCYALGMVILEVLSGQVPFSEGWNDWAVMRRILEGKHPERPQGAEEPWFTDELWGMLERCWSPQPKDRPTVKVTLDHLERVWKVWRPLPLSVDCGMATSTDDELSLTVSYLGMFPITSQSRMRTFWGLGCHFLGCW